MSVRPRAQFRYTTDGEEHDFRIRRARLTFGGHMFGKENSFKLELGLSPNDLGSSEKGLSKTPIYDFYADFRHFKYARIMVGQYKIPFSRQRVISSGNLQLVDRSIANDEFNLDRQNGVTLYTKQDNYRYYVGFYTGTGRDSGAFELSEAIAIARFEFLPLGKCDDYKEGVSGDAEMCVSIGAGYANRNLDTHIGTADYVIKVFDTSLFSDLYARHDDSGFSHGGSVQVGHQLPFLPFELAGRYGWVVPVDGKVRREYGVGASYYLHRHSIKLQSDFFRLDDGIKADDRFRVQLQTAF